MANFKKELKDAVISDEARKNLTPDELAGLERMIKEMMEEEIPEADLSSEKFDAKDMRPLKSNGPVRWKLINDPPPAKNSPPTKK